LADCGVDGTLAARQVYPLADEGQPETGPCSVLARLESCNTPKRKTDGLFKGKLWLDGAKRHASTGSWAIHQDAFGVAEEWPLSDYELKDVLRSQASGKCRRGQLFWDIELIPISAI